MSATIVITETGVITFHGVTDQNALILAQHALNLHRDLTAQMQARLQQMPQAEPRTQGTSTVSNGQNGARTEGTAAPAMPVGSPLGPEARWQPADDFS